MRNLKTLLTSGLVIGTCLFSAVPAMAATTTTNPNAAALTQIQTLRQQDKTLGDQLTSQRQSNQTQRTADWAQKNYTALSKAKTDQISFEGDYTTSLTDRFKLELDTIQLQADRQAKNTTNIPADLQAVIGDLNAQITIRGTLLTDAQTIFTDLGGTPAPTTPPAAQ
ncbi:conserved exported hypothetical protein [Candidatus Desulfosporosinus infrequens]|uniref:Outer membrane protein n=1 Tax=Candidatus Desulfosporosinus infrequens TaxID=2043169 RepID=A0A2U3KNK7_9FIRM|nr:conserved exported hypothetical protein [Candidatus Desulfosporosinus infrequens]